MKNKWLPTNIGYSDRDYQQKYQFQHLFDINQKETNSDYAAYSWLCYSWHWQGLCISVIDLISEEILMLGINFSFTLKVVSYCTTLYPHPRQALWKWTLDCQKHKFGCFPPSPYYILFFILETKLWQIVSRWNLVKLVATISLKKCKLSSKQ